ncbi:MAG: hypothetical protein JSU96_08400 [Acidobacteriota bacterium]|nr:MAG: hypothetical protein JSU96_08400 [Acidobacteriota bacterium]
MIYASVVHGVSVVPKDSKIYVPSPILFRGFMPLLDGFKSGIPAQDGAVVTGTLLINTDSDSEAESSYSILATADERAVIDLDRNGEDSGDEPSLTWDADNSSLHLTSNTENRPLEDGTYSFIFNHHIFSFGDQPLQSLYAAALVPNSETGETDVVYSTMVIGNGAQVIPQVAFGEAGDLAITTQFVLNNPFNTPEEVRIQLFDGQSGTPLEATIQDVVDSEHTVTVPASSSRLLEIETAGQNLNVGWASIVSPRQIGVAANYSTFNSSQVTDLTAAGPRTVQAEAGLAASPLATRHVLRILKTESGEDTAFAIVNPSGSHAQITLRLIRDEGSSDSPASIERSSSLPSEDQEVARKKITLNSQHQMAGFALSFFELSESFFAGTLVISSDADIAVTSLKTVDGKQSSSLPPGVLNP